MSVGQQEHRQSRLGRRRWTWPVLLAGLGAHLTLALPAFSYDDPSPRRYDATLDEIRIVLTTPGRALPDGRTRFDMVAHVPIVAEAVGDAVEVEVRKLGADADVTVTQCTYVPQPADVGTTVVIPCNRFEVVPVDASDGSQLLVYPYAVREASDPSARRVHDGRSTPLALTLVGDDAYEPNDTGPASTDLGTHASIVWRGLVSRNADYYRFVVPPGQGTTTVRIEFWHGASNLDLFVYDAAGRLLGASQAGGDVESLFVGVAEGRDYVVLVDNSGGLPVFYDLTIASGPADAVAIVSGPVGTPNPVGPRQRTSLVVMGTDSMGHPLEYAWSHTCAVLTGGNFTSSSSRTTAWRAPQNTTGEQQACTISVTASDAFGHGDTASVALLVDPVTESITLAAGPTGTPNPVGAGGVVDLDAEAVDPLGHPIAYEWQADCPLPGGGTFLVTRYASGLQWRAPDNRTGVSQVCQLTVSATDAFSHVARASVAVQVESVPDAITFLTPPTAAPASVAAGEGVALGVVAVDALGHPVVYSWSASCPTLVAAGAFDTPTSRNPTWIAPANPAPEARRCTLTVTASDAYGQTLAGSVEVSVTGVGYTTYFAEGATVHGSFGTRLALFNPDPVTPAHVTVTFQPADGHQLSHVLSVPPRRPVSLDVRGLARQDPALAALDAAEFAMLVHSDVPIVADRTMWWDRTGYGSHAEGGIGAPASTWYLAEGATTGNFALYYLLQNPNDTALDDEIEVTYLVPPPAAPIVRRYSMGAHARRNIVVNLEPGLEHTEVSAIIRTPAEKPIVVERAMYLSTHGQEYAAGLDTAAVSTPRERWLFAEGATGAYFEMFVLILNPNEAAAQVTATFTFDDGTSCSRAIGNAWQDGHLVLSGGTRYNLWVDILDLPGCPRDVTDAALFTTISADLPIVADRTMWWGGPTAADWTEAHGSTGATMAGTTWVFAEGEQGGTNGTETFILIASTSPYDGAARVTLYFEDGSTVEKVMELPHGRRTSLPLGAPADPLRSPTGSPERSGFGFGSAPSGKRFSIVVESLDVDGEAGPAQIVVERSTYGNAADGTPWVSGSNALGTRVR